MNTDTQSITIKRIDTIPERDPYVNIDGVVSRTFLKLDPRDRTVRVTQEYQDNSTLANEWNGLVLTWNVNSHPSEPDMRQWITDNLVTLTAICDGFEVHWNGSNHIGRLTDDARALVETIQFEFDNDAGPTNHYETWTVDSWLESSMDEITANMTDEQLAVWADAVGADATADNIILLGDILEYITQHRDNLKWDLESNEN